MFKTKKEIIDWLDYYKIYEYYIGEDLTVDVVGDVELDDKKLNSLPIQFDIINGGFNIEGNNLQSLKGCPREIIGDFNCDSNELKSLKYSPIKVSGSFLCGNNNLTTLKYSPIEVFDFWCASNQLENLEFCPKIVNGEFDCSRNKLNSLEFCPELVKENFYCKMNKDLGDFQLVNNFKEIFQEHKRIAINKYKKELELKLNLIKESNIKTKTKI